MIGIGSQTGLFELRYVGAAMEMQAGLAGVICSQNEPSVVPSLCLDYQSDRINSYHELIRSI